MVGRYGVGKTAILAAVCNELMINGHTCLFTTLSALLDKFSSYSFNNSGDITGLLMWLIKFDFIVLDDIGREAYTDKRQEIVFRIIDIQDDNYILKIGQSIKQDNLKNLNFIL